MLLFYCARKSELPALTQSGLPYPPADAVRLWRSFTAARAACDGALLLIDAAALPEAPAGAAGDVLDVPSVPPGAFLNLDPYTPHKPVEAAGGYVTRQGRAGPEVILIFRRGVWDLPKGKRDDGESIEACALREVKEEIGVRALQLVAPLGSTIHGYVRRSRYEVKTTHWFLMTTSQTHFTPQAEEDIQEAAWVPWGEAKARVGYETLRRHMQQIEPVLVKIP